jgi:hypothetical protein
MDDLQNQGTFETWIKTNDPDWATNDKRYDCGVFDCGHGMSFRAIKHPNRTLEIIMTGPGGLMHGFEGPVPNNNGPLFIVVSWKDGEIKLHLNGELVHAGMLHPSDQSPNG